MCVLYYGTSVKIEQAIFLLCGEEDYRVLYTYTGNDHCVVVSVLDCYASQFGFNKKKLRRLLSSCKMMANQHVVSLLSNISYLASRANTKI